MPSHRLLQIDAFTTRPFGGNPAAVLRFDDAWPDDDTLLAIALENNLSETAFIRPSADPDTEYDLRWFTPTIEMDLCGHATLAAAHALFNHLGHTDDRIRFHSRSGPLTVCRADNDRLEMDFPTIARREVDVTPVMTETLGNADQAFVGHALMVVFDNKRQVHELDPDLRAVSELDGHGVIVTAPGAGHDFVSRFFAPNCGVNEDPVTGSAHCLLAPYWADRLNKRSVTAHQVSARGGELWCTVDADNNRVRLQGHAVTVIDGTISF